MAGAAVVEVPVYRRTRPSTSRPSTAARRRPRLDRCRGLHQRARRGQPVGTGRVSWGDSSSQRPARPARWSCPLASGRSRRQPLEAVDRPRHRRHPSVPRSRHGGRLDDRDRPPAPERPPGLGTAELRDRPCSWTASCAGSGLLRWRCWPALARRPGGWRRGPSRRAPCQARASTRSRRDGHDPACGPRSASRSWCRPSSSGGSRSTRRPSSATAGPGRPGASA